MGGLRKRGLLMEKEELMWRAAWAGGMLGNRQQLVRAHEDKSRALGENSK